MFLPFLCVFRVFNRISEVVAEQLLPYSVLENLDLSANSISELKTGSFPPMQLKYLYIPFTHFFLISSLK